MGRKQLTDADFDGTARVVGLLDPASPQDGATKNYVDGKFAGYIPNWFYAIFGPYSTNSGTAAANTQYMGLWEPKADITIQEIRIKIGTTVVASSNIRLAIYAADATSGLPTGAPIWTSSSLSSATASTVHVISSLSISLQRGKRYWFAIQYSAATSTANSGNSAATTDYGYYGAGGNNAAEFGTSSMGCYLKSGITFGTWPTLTGNATTDGLSVSIANQLRPHFQLKAT